jgi:hypothetical protein
MSDAGTAFRIVDDWPGASPESAAAVAAFWLAEGAFDQHAQVQQRLPQLVAHALAPDGSVAGVCTAHAMTPPQLAQPMYYWRTFIGARWRSTPLVMQLLKHSCRLLEGHARAHDFPCIGVLLELENTRFRERGRAAQWWNPRFTYIGRSPRGLDVRVLYFKGARLR